MGISNAIVIPFYRRHIVNIKGDVALLGDSNNNMFDGDLYDLDLGNWEINSEWELDNKYDTIICTRCAYFSSRPEDFIKRCHDNLNENGLLYVDWGVGDHWRFPEFKVGWIDKNGKQEYAYTDNNYLWSMVWSNNFLDNAQCSIFEKEIIKRGYSSLEEAIRSEVPSIISVDFISEFFESEYHILTITKPYLQMYVLISGIKRNGKL